MKTMVIGHIFSEQSAKEFHLSGGVKKAEESEPVIEGLSEKRQQSKENKSSIRWIDEWRVKEQVGVYSHVHAHTSIFKKSERIKGNRRATQLAHNVSTPFSVGGRPRGTLLNTQGRNSTALSAEILIIYLHWFRKAKQPDERTVKPPSRSLWLSQSTGRKGSWKIYSFWRQESDTSCVKTSPIAQNHHNMSAGGLIRFLIDAKGSAITSLDEIYSLK